MIKYYRRFRIPARIEIDALAREIAGIASARSAPKASGIMKSAALARPQSRAASEKMPIIDGLIKP